MATLTQIIKDLQEIADSGGSGRGGASPTEKKAAIESKRLVELAKKINKSDEESLKQKKSLLEQARNQFKIGTIRYNQIEKQVKVQDDLIKANQQLRDITNKVGKSFVGLGKAAFEGTGSISAFTDNVRGLGILGNRLDVNIETFRQLSQSGANFGKSIVDLRLAAGEAALPLDDFAKLVASNSNNLAALFGSTTAGAKEIATLGRVTRELGIDRLAPLGFTVDEINETLLLNLDSQRRTGVANQLTDQQRVNSAINFAEELDRLAKLTGAQRDELRSQIEQQQSNERFQVALQGQTEETRRRLQGFAGTIGNIAPGLNEGFQDLIANAGVPVTESALALVQNIPQAQSIIRSLINGTVSAEQALGQIRDVSTASISRFSKATVTGQVEFLRFQGDIINLGRRIVDVDGVFQEQSKSATSLVSNLTSFEQATKVLSSQFQGIETALLQSFGPALGGLVGGIQTAFGAGGAVAKALAGAPALTASLIAGGLIGKVLFGPAVQVLTTAKGVAMGINMSKGGGMFGGMGKAFGKGGTGKGGAFGNFARTGIGRTVGAAGVGVNALSAYSSLSDDDKTNDASGIGTIAGTAIGGLLGLFGGPAGALLGASLGGAAGGALGGMFGGGKAFGGGMDAGKTYLTGERGPEMITAGTSSTVTANSDLKNTFNTEALEMKLNSTVSELNAANKTLTNMVNSVNTLVAVESRALKAVETTARKDRNQVGMV
jgi:hypothetical protein